MPRPKSAFDDLRPFEFREPGAVLDSDRMYTVYEIARLLQGVDPDEELDAETEAILLDWAIPWMLDHAERFCFAEPDSEAEPGFYGVREDAPTDETARSGKDGRPGEASRSASHDT